MGRPPKSARLQLLDGNPNRRNVEELERKARNEEKLKTNTKKIKPQKDLDDIGKIVFKHLKAELIETELITNADNFTLDAYCYWYSQFLQIRKESLLLKNFDPDFPGNPLIKQLDLCTKNIRSLGNDLGLSPTARVRLAANIQEEVPEWN